VRMLAALVAVRPSQRRAAVEAMLLVRVAAAFAGLRLDRPAEHASGHRVRNCFEIAHRHPRRHIMRR
jgi:hypothetical protein